MNIWNFIPINNMNISNFLVQCLITKLNNSKYGYVKIHYHIIGVKLTTQNKKKINVMGLINVAHNKVVKWVALGGY
jgi:hypothetical protein